MPWAAGRAGDEEDDGVHGERMKPLASVSAGSESFSRKRKPLGSCADRSNGSAARKRKSQDEEAKSKKANPKQEHKLDLLFMAVETCRKPQDAPQIKQRVSKQTLGGLTAPMFVRAAAGIAVRWLELINHDLKARLAALKRSRRRVLGVVDNLEDCRWMNVLLDMDAGLADEGSKLEAALRKVQEIQRFCEPAVFKGATRLPQQTAPAENLPALLAFAASICSTSDFALKR